MNLPGLNHQLGDDIDALREAVRAFVQRELAPRAAQIEQDNRFPSDLWRKLCLLYTSPSPRDKRQSRMPSSA